MSMELGEFFALERSRSNNSISVTGREAFYNNLSVSVPYLVLMCLATIMGSVGNILVIGAVLVNKHLKTVGNIFIVNLAFADLCVTGFVDPFSIIGIVYGEVWFLTRGALCEAIASICLTSCFCSLLSIGAISLNRYVHICHNSKYNRIYTMRNSVCMVIGLWLLSFTMELPNFIGWGDHVYDGKTMSCVWDRTADLSYTLFFSIAGVAFPVILISICYARIYQFVRQSKNKIAATVATLPAEGSGPVAYKLKKERHDSMRLARTLFIIFVVFAACWTPYAIIVAVDYKDTFLQEYHIFSMLLAHTNSSLNSILYGLTNQHFRKGYIKLLCLNRWLFRCKKKTSRTSRFESEKTGSQSTPNNGAGCPNDTQMSCIKSNPHAVEKPKPLYKTDVAEIREDFSTNENEVYPSDILVKEKNHVMSLTPRRP